MIDLKEKNVPKDIYISIRYIAVYYHQCETIGAFRTKIQTQSINSKSSLIDVERKKKSSISQSKNVFSVIHCNGHHPWNSHPTNILIQTFRCFSVHFKRNHRVIYTLPINAIYFYRLTAFSIYKLLRWVEDEIKRRKTP